MSRPAPAYWFNRRDNYVHDEDNLSTKHHKLFNRGIVSDKHPYFMVYRYPRLRREHNKLFNTASLEAAIQKQVDLKELLFKSDKTDQEQSMLEGYLRKSNMSYGGCIPNRICKLIEMALPSRSHSSYKTDKRFDYSIYKTDAEYDRKTFLKLKKLYQAYEVALNNLHSGLDELDGANLSVLWRYFKDQCDYTCPNPEVQCNCLVDIAYQAPHSQKVILWRLCGSQIIKNLLKKTNGKIKYPVETDGDFGEFVYNGKSYSMVESEVINWQEENNSY